MIYLILLIGIISGFILGFFFYRFFVGFSLTKNKEIIRHRLTFRGKKQNSLIMFIKEYYKLDETFFFADCIYHKSKIPAYDEKELQTLVNGLVQYEFSSKEYKKQVISNPIKVMLYLFNYLKNNKCDEKTKQFLKHILFNFKLLFKIQICFDGSARNIVFLVRPDSCYLCSRGPIEVLKRNDFTDFTLQDLIDYFYNSAETIFLNITNQTQEDQNLEDNFDYDQDYDDCDNLA